ncbi:MAG: alpha/beta hydrolase [bacterium]
MTTYRELPYLLIDGVQLTIDIYLPDDSPGLVKPIIWLHGGGWQEGRDTGCGALPLVKYGYAAIRPLYRLSGEAIFPAQIADCKAAIRWLRAFGHEYNLDTTKIGVMGNSAGGHLAALLGVSAGVAELETSGAYRNYSSAVQAVVDYFGPTDIYAMLSDDTTEKYDARDSLLSRWLGGPVTENESRADMASPIKYVHRGCPPTLILHGDADEHVHVNQSIRFQQALAEAGVDTALHIVPGAGHDHGQVNNAELVAAFFQRHL